MSSRTYECPFPRALIALLAVAACSDGSDGLDGPDAAALSVSVTADDLTVDELSQLEVVLRADYEGEAASVVWSQTSGPPVELLGVGPHEARAWIGLLDVAADVELGFQARVTVGDQSASGSGGFVLRSVDVDSVLGARVQIGGATRDVALLDGGGAWLLRGVGNRLESSPVAQADAPAGTAYLGGLVRDIEVVPFEGRTYALAALGSDGIAVVDATSPLDLQLLHEVRVGYEQTGLTWTDGGGNLAQDQTIAGTRGTVQALESDGETLWIANQDYGVQRTALANLLSPAGPLIGPDGTLSMDVEAFTLQYAGESPWGAPFDLELHDQRLFVASAELGLLVLDPTTLERLGAYNPYTDVSFVEDWCGSMDVANEVQPGFLDPLTGMPDYRQVAFEILEVAHGGAEAPTPWADFQGYGRYHYRAVGVALADIGPRTVAFVACSLGGAFAVDVTSPGQGEGAFAPVRLGYVPAVPVKGPEKPLGSPFEHDGSLVEHRGIGRLIEGGVRDVLLAGDLLFLADHFGGAIAVGGLEDPGAKWAGPHAPYDNDEDGIPGNHFPPYENVSSYDMRALDPDDHESMPACYGEPPTIAVSGELGGHGGRLLALPGLDLDLPGTRDLLQAVGAGGLSLLDVVGVTGPAGEASVQLALAVPTTREVGAAPDGSATQLISIGHTDGVAVANGLLFVADGPHGVSAWRDVDASGHPSHEVRLVANTVQSEGPVVVGGTTVLPATHATGLLADDASQRVLIGCKSLGLRLAGSSQLEDAHPGAPRLIPIAPEDAYEHKSGDEHGEELAAPAMPKAQDQAYGAALRGTLAFVADGVNGLTIYDLGEDPTDPNSGWFVANLGGGGHQSPALGTATGVALWSDPASGRDYALVAAGPKGIGVIDVTDPASPVLVKVFQPIKVVDEDEEGHVGKADGRGVDVALVGGHALLAYDSFGVVRYRLSELVAPLPEGVDPKELWKFEGGVLLFDHRPEAVGRFKLQGVPGYEDRRGGALYLDAQTLGGRTRVYVPYGDAGLAIVDWTAPAAPVLVELIPTAGTCTAATVANGRVYLADGSGGVVLLE